MTGFVHMLALPSLAHSTFDLTKIDAEDALRSQQRPTIIESEREFRDDLDQLMIASGIIKTESDDSAHT